MIRNLILLALIATTGACAGDVNDIAPSSDAGINLTDGQGPRAEAGQDAGQAPGVSDKVKFDKLVAFTQSYISKNAVPGAAIGVLLPGKQPMLRGIGLRRKGGAEKVTPDTLFSLASVSKAFTAATIMSLSEQGKLSLDDNVVKHLPTLKTSHPAPASQMTVAQLLMHTSGLGYASESALNSAPVNWGAPDFHIQMFEKVTWPIWSPPGAVWNYSNVGYSLAGVVIERASKRSYAAAVQEQILTPAGMSLSSVSAAVVKGRDHAVGLGSDGKDVTPAEISYAFDDPANGVYSSAREMITFLRILSGAPGTLSAASIQTMTGQQAPFPFYSGEEGYGYGVLVSRYGGVVVLSHSGGNWGYTSDFCAVPAKGFAVVALMNSEGGDPSAVTDKALELFTDLPGPPAPQLSTVQELQSLTGQYLDAFELGKVTLSLQGSQLKATFAKWGHTATMSQYDKRYFGVSTSAKMQQDLGASSEIYFTVYVDGSGKGTYLVSLWGVAARSGS